MIQPADVTRIIFKKVLHNNLSQVMLLRTVCKSWDNLTRPQQHEYYFQNFIQKINAFREALKTQFDKRKKSNSITALFDNNEEWDKKVQESFLPRLISLASSGNARAQFALFKAHCFPLHQLLNNKSSNSSDDFFEIFLPKEQRNVLLGYNYLKEAAIDVEFNNVLNKLNTIIVNTANSNSQHTFRTNLQLVANNSNSFSVNCDNVTDICALIVQHNSNILTASAVAPLKKF